MTSTVRVGVIGAGYVARCHVMAYQRVPDVEVVAIADIIPERSEALAREFNVPHTFTDYHDLLAIEEIDAVSVCTYNRAHRAPAVDTLLAGKHALVEKPLAPNLEDALAILQAARQSGRILHTGFWQHWQQNIKTAKAIVDSGALGTIYYAQMVGGGRRRIPGGSFLRKESAGAGVLVDIGCYDIDTFLYLTGDPRPISASAYMGYQLGKSLPNVPGDWGHDPSQVEVEDFATAFVRFENDLVLHLAFYWAAHTETLGPSVILGTRGGLQLQPELTLYRDEFGVTTNVSPQFPMRTEPNRMHHFVPQARIFTDAVRKGGPSPVDPASILISQVIMDGILRSAATNKEVALEIPTIE